MTATNTDFINQILSSTVRLCEKEKGCAGWQGASNMLLPHCHQASQRWSSLATSNPCLKFFIVVLPCSCIISIPLHEELGSHTKTIQWSVSITRHCDRCWHYFQRSTYHNHHPYYAHRLFQVSYAILEPGEIPKIHGVTRYDQHALKILIF